MRGSLSAWSCARPVARGACVQRIAKGRPAAPQQRPAGRALAVPFRICLAGPRRHAAGRCAVRAAPAQAALPRRRSALASAPRIAPVSTALWWRPRPGVPRACAGALTRFPAHAPRPPTLQASSRAWTRSCQRALSTRCGADSRATPSVARPSAHAPRRCALPPPQVVTSIASSPAGMSVSPVGPLTGAHAARASWFAVPTRSALTRSGAQTPGRARR